MRPRALFVDCYGTLVAGDRPVIDQVVQATAQRAGVEPQRLDRSWWERFTALCARHGGTAFAPQRDLEVQAMREVLDGLGAPLPERRILRLMEPLFHYWRTAEPLPDAVEFLENWRGGPVIVVSNIDRDDLRHVLRTLPPVAGAVTSEDARAYKPDPSLFRHALATVGAPPGEVVHAGDSWESDVLGATAAGITAVWVEREITGRDGGRRNSHPRITSLRQLQDCLERLPDDPRPRVAPAP